MCWAARPWCWQPQRRCRMCRRTRSPPSWLQACSLKRRRLVACSGESLFYSFIACGSWRATLWHQGLPALSVPCVWIPGCSQHRFSTAFCSEVTGSFLPCHAKAGHRRGMQRGLPEDGRQRCCNGAAGARHQSGSRARGPGTHRAHLGSERRASRGMRTAHPMLSCCAPAWQTVHDHVALSLSTAATS